jgi:hypothetical protein
MPANKTDRIRIGIVVGLALILVTVVLLRFFHSKTADGVLVPHAGNVDMTRLAMPKVPAVDLEIDGVRQKEAPESDLLILTRDIFRPSSPPPLMDGEKNGQSKSADTPRPVPTCQLKGTFTGGSEPLAIVDDRFVRCGDVIQDYTVTRIDEDKVFLRSGKHEIALEVLKVIDPPTR